MPNMTYSSLVAQVEAYLDRDDSALVTQIPSFISNAVVRVARELRILPFQRTVTSAFTSGSPIVSKPADWRETIVLNCAASVGGTSRNTLLPRSYEYLRSYWPDPSVTGTPKYYADYGYDHILVAPTPSAALPFEMTYTALLAPLDETNQTNKLTEYAPDMLLYATLLESAPYLKADERIPTWQSRYDRCLQAEVIDDIRNLIDQSVKASENKA
jgi:hypothetical protein